MTTQDSAANPFEFWREMFQKSTGAWAQAAAGSSGNAFWPPRSLAPRPALRCPAAQRPVSTRSASSPRRSSPTACNRCGSSSLTLGRSRCGRAWREARRGRRSSRTRKSSGRSSWKPWPGCSPRSWAPMPSLVCSASTWSRRSSGSSGWPSRPTRRWTPCSRLSICRHAARLTGCLSGVIGLEERIDDLEDDNRKLRGQLDAALRTAAPRSRARAPETPPASGDGSETT